jgi:hypothetical protein
MPGQMQVPPDALMTLLLVFPDNLYFLTFEKAIANSISTSSLPLSRPLGPPVCLARFPAARLFDRKPADEKPWSASRTGILSSGSTTFRLRIASADKAH